MKTKIFLSVSLLFVAIQFASGWAEADKRWTCLFQSVEGYRKFVHTFVYAKHPTYGWGKYDECQQQCCCASKGCDSRYFGVSNVLAWAHAFVANSSHGNGEAWTWTNDPHQAFKRSTGAEYAYARISAEDMWDGNHLKLKLTGMMGMGTLSDYNLKYRVVIWNHSSANDHVIDNTEILWDSQISIRNQVVTVSGDFNNVTNFGYSTGAFADSTTVTPDTVWLDLGEFDSTEITLTLIADVLPDNFIDDEYDWGNGQSTQPNSVSNMNNFEQTISFYPNPIFHQDLEIRSNKTLEGCKIIVVDLVGKEIKREEIVTVVKEFTLPLKTTKEGVYIVTIISKEGIKLINEKIVKY